MFKSLLLASVVFTGMSALANEVKQAPIAANTAMDPKVEVQKFLDDFANTWNTHDVAKMAAFWAQDGDLINPFGKWGVDRKGVEEVFTFEQNGPLKGSTQKFVVEKIRSLSPDILFVDANSMMTVPKKDKMKDMHHHVSFVLAKKEGKFSIVAARPYMFQKPKKQDRENKQH